MKITRTGDYGSTRGDGQKRLFTQRRKLHTTAGQVAIAPNLRKQACETAIIGRYRRRDPSIEECIVKMYLASVSVRRVEVANLANRASSQQLVVY